MTISRRNLLRAAGVLGVASAFPVTTARAQPGAGSETVTLTTTVVGTGTYAYLPFEMPPGVNRVEVAMEKSADAALGLGMFDQRGPHYQSPGFRGIYGEERSEFFLAAHEASQAFIPGTIEPGTWTVVVPVFQARQPTTVTVTVTLRFGPQRAPFVIGPPMGVVRDAPGWYRGDLHCHTPESSDAWASGSALTPREWAHECRRIGLDYAAMTDHNVVSQNYGLARDAGAGVLLMPGEEMTNWFHGHATVTGMAPDEWLDWRQRPLGVPLQDHEARITELLGITREMGAYVSAAHPLFANLTWQFFGDAQADQAAETDAIEVWTAQFRPDCESALRYWDSLLVQGRRVFANGGSDLHGTVNDLGFVAGTPTTVVYAEQLSIPAITAALRLGRSFVTRLPHGVDIYLRATGPGEQEQIPGGTIYGGSGDAVEVEAIVRRAAGMRLILWADGAPVSVTQLSADEETVGATIPIGPGGYVRAEVRSEPFFNPEQPLGSRLDMEAFTNPIFLVNGPEPDDNEPVVAPPPPAGEPGQPGEPPEQAPPPAGPPDSGPPPSQSPPPQAAPASALPATGAGPGGGLLLGAGGAAAAALGRRRRDGDGAVGMTMTEVVHHAGTGSVLEGVMIAVVGEVTAIDDDGATLSRWAPGCCADTPVDVQAEGLHGAPVGSWWSVVGRWVPGTGADFAAPPRLAVRAAEPVSDPPPRREAG